MLRSKDNLLLSVAAVVVFVCVPPFHAQAQRHEITGGDRVSKAKCPEEWPSEIPNTAWSFLDAHSGLILYLETDHRHIAAINSIGKVVWLRDPFEDAHLSPYRIAKPRITRFAPLLDCQIRNRTSLILRNHFIFVGFDSSQFGSLDARTGDFLFEGQN